MKTLQKKMGFLLLLCSLNAFTYTSSHAQADDFVYVLIIDKTKSMTGYGDGGGIDIWNNVKDFIVKTVDGFGLSSKLIIFQFDRDIYGPKIFELNSNSAKENAKQFIREIVPDGMNTGIYKALNHVFDYLDKNYKDNRKLIYLLTDGLDNIGEISFKEAINKFSALRGEYDHLYYIDLRNSAPDDVKEEIARTPQVLITKDYLTPPLTINPLFTIIPVVHGKSNHFAQRFQVHGSVLPDDFSFNVSLRSANPELNIDITPTVNIGKRHLKEIEDGRYECDFKLEYFGNIDQPVDVEVTLIKGAGNLSIIDFQPNKFIVRVRLPEPPRATVLKGGWR